MKRNVTIALSMLAVFVSGGLVGAVGHKLYTVRSVSADVQPARPSPDDWRRGYVSELQTRLNLEESQLSKLNTILDETRDRFRAMKERSRPEAEQIKQEQRNQVRAMLSATQRAEYEKILQERDKKHAEQKR
jgi:uncharacterized membrane protein